MDVLAEGAARIRALGEVHEDGASPPIAAVYEDIRATLRVPFVNYLFRMLAGRPAYLAASWGQLAPVARTEAFEAAADELREAAAGWARSELGERRGRGSYEGYEGAEALRRFTATIHHVLPKLLLTATAFHEGRVAAGPRARAAEPFEGGPLDGALGLPMVDPATAEGRVAAIFERVLSAHRHPGVASYYRALGLYPAFLEAAWQVVEPHLERTGFARAHDAALVAAHEAVAELFEPPAEPLPHADEVAPALAVFRHRLIPDLLLDVSLIRAWAEDD